MVLNLASIKQTTTAGKQMRGNLKLFRRFAMFENIVCDRLREFSANKPQRETPAQSEMPIAKCIVNSWEAWSH